MANTHYYINGIGILSPQKTYNNNEFLSEILEYDNNVLTAVSPDFKEYIHPIQLRRLSRMLRIGLTAALICTKDSGVTQPHGIITGTGYGFLNDTAKFVTEILQQHEKHVTPTFFMQSTYNALSGLVALSLKCNGYNNTYVNKGFSFETALHDAMMQLNESGHRNFMVGTYDEADEVQYKVNIRVNHYKAERINNLQLFEHHTKGSIQGESAAFFLLSNERAENCWCILKSIKMIFKPTDLKMLLSEMNDFLSKNETTIENIDVFVNGMSGDVNNDKLIAELASEVFNKIPEVRFKHLSGEYCTASAFGMWLGASILKKQSIPQPVQFNTSTISTPLKTILLINQYMGRNYSFILLKGV